MSILTLLKKAVSRLSCPKECSSACSACLFDYSNQQSWDQFDRLPVLRWLKELTDNSVQDIFINAGASRWEKPTLRGMSDRLSGASDIHFTGFSLINPEGDEDNVMEWIISLLSDGKNVFIHLFRPLEFSASSLTSGMRRVYRHFYPYMEDGRLKIGYLPEFDESKVFAFPRIFISTEKGSPAWYSACPASPLFYKLCPEPFYQHVLNEESALELSDKIQTTIYYSSEKIQLNTPIQRWELSEREERNYREYFGVLQNTAINKAVIKDPYCGAGESQQRYLLELLNIISEIANIPETIKVYCREQNYKDIRYMAPQKVQENLKVMIETVFPLSEVTVHVHTFKENRAFHDRTLEFNITDSEGCSVIHRYDLSGGIDYLMNKNVATKIYRYQI